MKDLKEVGVTKTKRKYQSEVDLTPVLKLEPISPKEEKPQMKKFFPDGIQIQTFQPEMIQGIIERIKKL